MVKNPSTIRCFICRSYDQCRRLAFTAVSYISLQFRPKHCSCLQNMNLALGVYFLLAVLYKGKFEISFGDSIIYVHSHNEFAALFGGSTLFHGWMGYPLICFTTNLFKGRLTLNYSQAPESQSLIKLLLYATSTRSYSTSPSPPAYKPMSFLIRTIFLAEKKNVAQV